MLIRYINPDKAHNRRAVMLLYDLSEKRRYWDCNPYITPKLLAFHYETNRRLRNVMRVHKETLLATRGFA